MLLINDNATLLRATRPTRLRAASAPVSAAVLPARAATPEHQRPSGVRRVALLIETSGSYGRGLLQGIARYNRERGGWSTYFRPQGLVDPLPDWIRHWGGDGILIRAETS